MSYREDLLRAMRGLALARVQMTKVASDPYAKEGVWERYRIWAARLKNTRGIHHGTMERAGELVDAMTPDALASMAASPMQCKNIPDAPILAFLASHPGRLCTWGKQRPNGAPSVAAAMPPSTPERLQIRKMARLIERGLVDGCGCGCRGAYHLPQKP